MDYFEMFLEYKKSEQKSPKTLRVYKNQLEFYKKWLESMKLEVTQVKRQHIIMYRSYMASKYSEKMKGNLKDSTIQGRLVSLRSFYNYMVDIEVLTSNPARGISVKVKKRLPVYLNEDELREYAEIAKANPINHLIFILIVDTGVRMSELTNIRKKDVDTVKCQIKVLGKGDKERIVYFPACHRTEILGHLRDLKPDDLILGEVKTYRAAGKRIEKMTNVFNMYRTENGKNIKNITGHKIRSTYATKCYRDGADLISIQKTMGHVNINTTRIYTDLEDKAVQEAINCRKGMESL